MTQQHPAGWYDDGSGQQRWFDGQTWTEQTRPVPPPTGMPLNENATAGSPTGPSLYCYPTGPVASPAKGLAVAALTTGIVAFLTGWVPVWGILAGGAAVTLGVLALRGRQSTGLSITGIILGALAVLASLLTTIGLSVSPSTSPAPGAVSVAATSTAPSAAPTPSTTLEVSATPTDEETASPADDESDDSADVADDEEAADDPGYTMSQEQAIDKAAEYLDYSAFSKSGLINQLKFEGFSKADAAFAVEHVNVDWNEQAELKAQEYLDYSSFSRSGLIHQLEFEGFTHKQAVHGVDAVGL